MGAGFGGLKVAQALRDTMAQVTVVDQYNFHLFQPLLYQVATAGLSPADIAVPIRSILRKGRNIEIMMARVTGVDVARRLVFLDKGAGPLSYDSLVLATGSSHHYFNHPEWTRHAPGLKTITDATRIRCQILTAFERAEAERDPELRRAWLRFVVVGGGPTGVELAGSIAELAHRSLARDFRHIDPTSAEILVVEASARVLAGFPESLSRRASAELSRLGVKVLLGCRVRNIDAEGVDLPLGPDNQVGRLVTRSVIWAAGVVASPAARWLGAETDPHGRIRVEPDLSLPGHPEVFAIGDTSFLVQDGEPLPGVAPVALQMGHYVGKLIRARAEKGARARIQPFRYRNKGNLATVGRVFAVADLGPLRISGFVAWLLWVVIHIVYLIGFRSRIVVLVEWAWAYLTFQRGARLITEAPIDSP